MVSNALIWRQLSNDLYFSRVRKITAYFSKRPGKFLSALLLLAVLLALAGYTLSSSSRLNKELQLIRSHGLPVTPVELDVWHKHVPAAENRALLVLEAQELHVRKPGTNDPGQFGNRELPPGEPLRPEIVATFEDYLAQNAPALAKLHAAAERPKSRYPVDFKSLPTIGFRHRTSVRYGVQLLRVQAILSAEKGDSEQSLSALLAGFAVCESLAHEPLTISALVHAAILGVQITSLEQALARTTFDPAALAALENALRSAELDCHRALSRSVIGERVFGIASFHSLNSTNFTDAMAFSGLPAWLESTPEQLRPAAFHARRLLGMHHADLSFFVSAMGDFERAGSLDFSDYLKAITEITSRTQAELDARPVRLIYSNMALSSITPALRREVLLASRLRCAEAALSIERFRLHHGRLPTPEEIGGPAFPKWPRDAANNQPLAYEPLAPKGFRVTAPRASELANEGRAPDSTNRQAVAFIVHQ
jgi:hypothetical protein